MGFNIDLSGKGALVTGSARGIGRAVAETLLAAGAKVVINDLSPEAVEETAKELDPSGEKVFGIAADVSNSASVAELINAAQEKLGNIDILVNNAGITRDGLLMRMKEEQWDMVLNINLKSAFLVTKAVCRNMMRTGGAIVNMASVVGQMGAFGQTNYSASKAGLIGFTKSCAREMASRNIRVNAIAPGFIKTPMTDALKEEIIEKIKTNIPMGSLGVPEDVAKAVTFLVSDAASYITGQVLNVDGGMVMAR
jgi:3-oxoacyl-[acyl-carrier protein] reductase